MGLLRKEDVVGFRFPYPPEEDDHFLCIKCAEKHGHKFEDAHDPSLFLTIGNVKNCKLKGERIFCDRCGSFIEVPECMSSFKEENLSGEIDDETIKFLITRLSKRKDSR